MYLRQPFLPHIITLSRIQGIDIVVKITKDMTSLCIKFPDKHIWGAAHHPGARALFIRIWKMMLFYEKIYAFLRKKNIYRMLLLSHIVVWSKKNLLASWNFAKKSFSTSEQTIRKYLVIIGSMLRNNTSIIFFWNLYYNKQMSICLRVCSSFFSATPQQILLKGLYVIF